MDDLTSRAIDNEAQRRETERILTQYDVNKKSTPALEAAMAKLAEERIQADRFRYYVFVPTMKVANMWLRPRTELTDLPLDWWNFGTHEKASWEALGLALWNAAYLALAAFGARRWYRAGWGLMGLVCVVFTVLRCALLWTIDNSEPRYTLECFPMLMLWGAYTFRRDFVLSENSSVPSKESSMAFY